jgi:hypothetical protein
MSSSSLMLKLSLVLAKEAVEKCGAMYGFKVNEAWEKIEKELLNEVEEGRVSLVVKDKEVKAKENKVKLILPFDRHFVKSEGCQGLSHNYNLFTQCQGARLEGSEYCSGCTKDAQTSESGKPICGTVTDRLLCDDMEYVDPRGRKVVSYLKALGKNKEKMLKMVEEAGIVINEVHLKEESKEDKKRGRPKKEVKKMETEVEDIFASLSSNNSVSAVKLDKEIVSVEDEVEFLSEKIVSEVVVKVEKVDVVLSEKELKAKALKEEKELKAKQAKEEKDLKAKALKEEKALKAKEEKELKAKQAKEEKELKAKQEKEAKELKAKEVPVPVPVPVQAPVVVEEEKPEKVKVSEFTLNGKKYLKSTLNQIFDLETHEEIGVYNETTGEIDECEEESDDEMEEEEYDEEE